jgi:molybdopterin-guanine dinucleotide biosynthesis protein B
MAVAVLVEPTNARRVGEKHILYGATSTSPRVFGLAGWSGAGKTTLLTRLIPALVARGLRVSTIKHAHHAFDIDQPGKDSHTHRLAGASEVLVSSSRRWALMHELRQDAEPTLAELLRHLSKADLVLIEGFKRDPHPKLEVHRPTLGKTLLQPGDPAIVAIASDAPLSAPVPVIDLADTDGLVAVILAHAAPFQAPR